MGAIILGQPYPAAEAVSHPAPELPAYGRVGVGGLLNATHVSLAREIAQGMTPMESMPRLYGYESTSDPRWIAVLEHPEFQRLLAEAVREWNSAEGTAKRIAYKARAAVESNIEVLHAGINDPTTPYVQKVEGMKMLSRLGGVGESAALAKGSGGAGFSVTINIEGGAGRGGEQVRLSAAPSPSSLSSPSIIEGDSFDVGESTPLTPSPSSRFDAVMAKGATK